MKDAIKKALSEHSDFAFEMRVVRELLAIPDFNVEHSGVYQDAATRKIRQFDIRANFRLNAEEQVFLAIECKNLSTESPLVFHTVPRGQNDQGIWYIYRGPLQKVIGPGLLETYSSRIDHYAKKIDPAFCRYHQNGIVSKSMDRLVPERDQAKLKAGNIYRRDDSEVYEKMNQALASIEEMICASGDLNGASKMIFTPVLVVPDGSLWAVNYDMEGNIISDPQPILHSAFYQNRLVRFPVQKRPIVIRNESDLYPISHMEITTIGNLKKFIAGMNSSKYGTEFRNIFGTEPQS